MLLNFPVLDHFTNCRHAENLQQLILAALQKGGIGSSWFLAHRTFQIMAALLAFAGFILALVVFDVSWKPNSEPPHRLYDLHRILGVVVMAFVVIQVGLHDILGISHRGHHRCSQLYWHQCRVVHAALQHRGLAFQSQCTVSATERHGSVFISGQLVHKWPLFK